MGFLASLFGKKQPSPEEQATRSKLAGRTMVYADASMTIRKVLELCCTDMGINGTGYETALELVDSLRSTPADVVLVCPNDLGSDGHSIAQTIKQLCPGARVFLLKNMTGSLPPGVETQLGLDGVLIKPFAAKELFAAIARAL